MGVRVFTSRLIRASVTDANVQSLVEKFKAYKESGNPAQYFGRDVPFDRPRSAVEAELRHVHLNDGQRWQMRTLQFHNTSDTHLIYCQGYLDADCFLLIELLKDSHDRYRNLLYVAQLADIADSFRQKY